MVKFKKLIILFLVVIITLTACGKNKNNPQKESPHPYSGKMPGANLGKKNVPVIVHVIKPEILKEYVKIVGTLEGITDIVLTSETNGKVVEIYEHLGDWVNKGESIGKIDNTSYQNQLDQAKAVLKGAQASSQSAKLNLKASQKLYHENKISQQEFLQAKISKQNADAALEGAKASLEMAKRSLDNSQFIAPVSGFITNLNIEIGEMITAGSPICNLVNSRKLKLKTGLCESDILTVKKGQKVTLHNDEFNEKFAGVITGVGIKPIKSTANYPIEIVVENQEGKLLPGMVVEGYILSKTHKNVIYISLNNILERYDDRYVYIVDENNVAYEQKVQLGKKIKREVIIKSGLQKGDKLVVEGFDNLEDGVEVKIK